jgi:hypothetical protein
MARPSSLRALAAILLTACLVVSLSVRLGAGEIQSKKAAQEACQELGADRCCQPSGERAPHHLVQIPPPDVVFAAQPPFAALPTPDPARVRSSPEPAAAPAVIQGVGFFPLLC